MTDQTQTTTEPVAVERIQFAIDAIAHLKPEKARFALEQMIAACLPAAPTGEGK